MTKKDFKWPKSWRYITKKVKCDGWTDRPTDKQTDQRTDGPTKRGVESRSTRLKRIFWGEGDGVIAPQWAIRHCFTHVVFFHNSYISVPYCLWRKIKHWMWLITIKPSKSSWTLNWKSKAKIFKVHVTFAWRFLPISLILKAKTLGYDAWKLK